VILLHSKLCGIRWISLLFSIRCINELSLSMLLLLVTGLNMQVSLIPACRALSCIQSWMPISCLSSFRQFVASGLQVLGTVLSFINCQLGPQKTIRNIAVIHCFARGNRQCKDMLHIQKRKSYIWQREINRLSDPVYMFLRMVGILSTTMHTRLMYCLCFKF
jgi:hypothetical protein